jgi:type 1 glutamine amidotransferase
MKAFQLFLAIVLACAAGQALSADSSPKTRVLVVTGGHGFEEKPFFKMFSDNAEIEFTAAAHSPTNASAFERSDLLNYDVVVLYDMPQNITAAQKSKFLALFDKGTGMVVLHHALASYQNWPEYDQLIGGRYQEPDPKQPGTVTASAGYEHDVDIPVVIVATNHPVTAGVGNFMINDEIYWGYRVGATVTPLISTTHPKSGKPLAWAHSHGKSRVVYIQLGHGPQAFRDANYRRLVSQGIRWTARR